MILIPLSRGLFALVDDEDADLRDLKWSAGPRYAHRATRKPDGRHTTQSLHRVIGARIGLTGTIDHKNRGGFDCRRTNLRAATYAQNAHNRSRDRDNTSGFKGVNWFARNRRWRAYIAADRKVHHLGYFDDPESAARAYDCAARELHGEFAVTNFPQSMIRDQENKP